MTRFCVVAEPVTRLIISYRDIYLIPKVWLSFPVFTALLTSITILFFSLMHAMDTIVMVLNQIRRPSQYFGQRIGMDGMFFVMQSSDKALLFSKKCLLEVFVSRPM